MFLNTIGTVIQFSWADPNICQSTVEFCQGVTKLKPFFQAKFVLNSEEDSGKSDPDNITLTATLRLDWTWPDFSWLSQLNLSLFKRQIKVSFLVFKLFYGICVY